MKLSKGRCRIVGVRVGELDANSLDPDHPYLRAKFVLVGEDGNHHGSYTKERWSEATEKAFEALTNALETDALEDLFDGDSSTEENEEEESTDGLKFPTLG